MTTIPSHDHVLDCRGVLCPMPVVRLGQEIRKIEAGKVIKVIATDPGSVKDMPAFARNTGHELLEVVRAPEGVFEFYFRKSAEEEE